MENKSQIKLFSGNSNPVISREICKNLGINLGNLDIKRFSDGEIFVQLNESVADSDCIIVQSTHEPVNDNLIELLIISDALRRSGARKIIAVIPYFGYARQDKRITDLEPLTAKLISNLISSTGIDSLITVDIHSLQILGYFDILTKNIMGSRIFYEYVTKLEDFNINNFVFVAPDCGAVGRTRQFSKLFGSYDEVLPKICIIDKYRPRANVSEVMNIIGDVKNKKIVIFDDIIDTAGTICSASEALRSAGALEIYVCASHAVLSGNAIERIRKSLIKEFVFLNTILINKSKKLENFKILSISNEISNFLMS
ncbi:MAG: ribose-phosphate diphosphokinase [Candidatus Improbicoccus devescovinae]|nr:MAG: ribose-phosphate diphosphokinase [Candidatus Improbicoccus devescovinae]